MKFVSHIIFLALIFILSSTSLVSAQGQNLTQISGQVINIPIDGTNVPWLVSNYQEDGYVMVMSMANVCAVPAVGCTTATGADSTTGTPWNGTSTTTDCSTTSATGRCNQLASLKTYNYLKQMDNIYDNLPATIAGLAKNAAIRDTTWNMDGFSYGYYAETTATRSVGYNAPQIRPVNLASVFEWQVGFDNGSGNPSGYGVEPAANSLGNLFCQARFGTVCKRSAEPYLYNAPNPSWLTGTYNVPWLRSARSDSVSNSWYLIGSSISSSSLGSYYTDDTYGLLPVMWISSNLSTGTGLGTFENPYELGVANTAPTISLISPNGNPWLGINTVAVNGTVSDSDASQTLTVQYQWNGTAGNWNTLQTGINTPATNAAFSNANIDISDLSEGTNTLNVRVCDNASPIACSSVVSATIRIDRTPPTCGTTWTPADPVPWKNIQTAGTQVFTLTGSTDSGSGMAELSYACIAAANNGATCNVTISDNVGNTVTCPNSPANRIDTDLPTITINVSGGILDSSNAFFVSTPDISTSGTDPTSGLAGIKHVWLNGDGSGITSIVGGIPIGNSATTTAQNCLTALSEIEFYTTESFPIPDNGTFTLCARSFDNAGNASDVIYQSFTLDSSAIIYTPNFNTLNVDCQSPYTQGYCIFIANQGDNFTLSGSLMADPNAPTNLEICLQFMHVDESINPICTTVSTSTAPSTYTFSIPTNLFPNTRDVFISTTMTTTVISTGNTHTQPVYFVLFVKRPPVPINTPVRTQNFIYTRNGALN